MKITVLHRASMKGGMPEVVEKRTNWTHPPT